MNTADVPLTRRPAFWIAYVALALIALGVAWQLFPLAIPLVNLDITMPRGEALARAESLAADLKLVPAGARSAVRFSHDNATQNYVELEGGGKPAFAELIKGDLYAPYWWDVRLFAPGVVEEAMVRFKPDGTSNGFVRRLPEAYVRDQATKALSPQAARELAEEHAKTDWKIDIAPYALLEQSQQTRPAGRVDHVFVYERPEKLGEARIRLRITVSGDELTEITPYVHVPESFDRRFSELRSANDTIAGIAAISAGLLYGVGGCIIGVLWLARRHWLVVRPALAAGFIVSGLLAAMTLASVPVTWFAFDTAQATSTFWLRQAGAAIAIVLGGGLAYALVFMTAESLTRRAFPHQPQLWRLWSAEAGATHAVLGRTLGGYLFVPVELALVAAFYYATNRWLGWWQPSEVLTDPNALSLALPALMPIAVSLQAGFMEECMFRAVPLALGALIGARFGARRLGLAIAFVLQAVIFGAAHANYPGFPSYSRLVELVVPAMIWAAIFLRFGLLPTILLHAVFDLTLFSIPLYLVDAPGAWVQRAMVVLAALVPLGVVLWRRVSAGAWKDLRMDLRNGAWTPVAPAHVQVAPAARADASRGVKAVQRLVPALAVAGAIAWLVFTPRQSDVPPLAIDRAHAEAAADAALAARGIVPGPEWRRLSTVRLASDEGGWSQHKFVWREAGEVAYRALVGATLPPPLWEVRYAMFDGDVAARAEEWRVTIDPAGAVRQIRHALPEARQGARLARDEARVLAEREIAARYAVDPAGLTLVAAQQSDQPARTDWSFTFKDPRIAVGDDGEARIVVSIAGDEVVGAGRYVHVPEPWLRAERDREGRRQIAKLAGALVFAIAAIAAIVTGVRGWMRHHCDTRAATIVFAIAFVAAMVEVAVMWPSAAMRLKTTEPVAWQMTLLVAGTVLAGAFGAIVVSLASGVGAWAARVTPRTALAGFLPPWAAGVGTALFVAGAAAFAGSVAPSESPLWPSLAWLSAASPLAAAALDGLGTLGSIGVGLFVLYLLDRATAGWTRRSWLALAVVIALIAGLIVMKSGEARASAVEGLVAGVFAAIVVYCVLRFDARAIPGYVAASAVIDGLENALLAGTKTGWEVFAVAAAVSVAVAALSTFYIGRPLALPEPAPSAPPEPAR